MSKNMKHRLTQFDLVTPREDLKFYSKAIIDAFGIYKSQVEIVKPFSADLHNDEFDLRQEIRSLLNVLGVSVVYVPDSTDEDDRWTARVNNNDNFTIYMPRMSAFASQDAYYYILFHEIGHIMQGRLSVEFEDDVYSGQEVTAELVARRLLHDLGVPVLPAAQAYLTTFVSKYAEECGADARALRSLSLVAHYLYVNLAKSIETHLEGLVSLLEKT